MTTIQRIIVCFAAGALVACSQPAPGEDLCQRLDACTAPRPPTRRERPDGQLGRNSRGSSVPGIDLRMVSR